MRFIIIVVCVFFLISCKEDTKKTPIDFILHEGSESFQAVIENKDKYEVQILFSPINRLGDSIVVQDYFFNYRPGEYFYPASSIKMPVVFLALQKLEELRKAGIAVDRDTPLRIDSIRPPQSSVEWDSTAINNRPSLAHYIDKVFAVSDNDAYNRLYEFCGVDYMNASLRSKGIFTNSRIIHRVGVIGFSFDENRHTPPIHFLDEEGVIKFTSDSQTAQGHHITLVDNTLKGKAYLKGDKLIEEPFDFNEKNFINIRDLQESLKRLVLPELYYPLERYAINENDRKFVLESMAKLPRDHSYLKDQTSQYFDSYGKFFLFGDSKDPIPDHIIIRNKVGYAYGYLTDCAYIHDTKEGIEYFLTATIHVNENQTYNDGIYEYEEIGIPFLAELGRLAHDYMIKNK